METTMHETKSWRSDPAAYSAHCARIRAYKARRKERRKDRAVRWIFAAAVVFFLWAVSVAAVLLGAGV